VLESGEDLLAASGYGTPRLSVSCCCCRGLRAAVPDLSLTVLPLRHRIGPLPRPGIPPIGSPATDGRSFHTPGTVSTIGFLLAVFFGDVLEQVAWLDAQVFAHPVDSDGVELFGRFPGIGQAVSGRHGEARELRELVGIEAPFREEFRNPQAHHSPQVYRSVAGPPLPTCGKSS